MAQHSTLLAQTLAVKATSQNTTAESSPTITLIIGSNRVKLIDINGGFLKAVIARANSIVIAVNIDAAVETNAATATESLNSDGEGYIDCVIANVSIGNVYKQLLDTDLNGIKRHMQVDFFSAFALVKGAIPLLPQAKGPKMIFVWSGVASFAKCRESAVPWFFSAVTKTVLHYTAS